MDGVIGNINQKAKENNYFRQVLVTGPNTQIVIMSIDPGGEIGEEVHNDNDQVLYLVEGKGQVVLDGVTEDFSPGDIVLVKKGTRHNFISSKDIGMKIITMYSPPHHPEGTIHKTKEEADKAGY